MTPVEITLLAADKTTPGCNQIRLDTADEKGRADEEGPGGRAQQGEKVVALSRL